MGLLDNLYLGLTVAFSLDNVFYCLLGAILGTFVGVLPGLSPPTVIAVLLPITFYMSPVSAVILLAGIYYGAHHAMATTAVMLNLPGEPSSVVICLDGHPMAVKGRAGAALSISALSSFFAGFVALAIIIFFAPPLASAALSFHAPEYTATIVLALVAASVISNKDIFQTLAMACVGLLIGCVGTDLNSGVERFTFGSRDLIDGIEFSVVAVGLFAFTEVIAAVRNVNLSKVAKMNGLLPTREELSLAWKPTLRGTALGSALGILPGTGPFLSTFASYALERRLAKDPSRFGKGAVEGIAGPEAANNAAALTHFIPMLTLGIPAGATMALMLGALTMQGIPPGPQVMTKHPELFWGLIVSMGLGNIMLLVLNLPLVGIWVRLLSIPYRFLNPTILVFCCVGVYAVSNNAFDLYVAAGFGALGYLLKKLDCEPAPLVLGLVLGPMLEEYLRRSLLLSHGDPTVFITRPISCSLLALTLGLVVYFAWPRREKKETVEA
jgi:putative tricarboxylic transport membrane protein